MNFRQSMLIEKRKVLKMTQQELADKTGLSTRTIQRIEAGDTVPQDYSLRQIMKALNIEENDWNTDSISKKTIHQKDLKFSESVLTWSTLLAVFVPINLIIIFTLRFFYRNKFVKNEFAKKIIGFQVLWTIFQITIILSIPLLTFILTEQKMNGLPVLPQLTHILLTIINLFLLFQVSKSLKRRESNILIHYSPQV